MLDVLVTSATYEWQMVEDLERWRDHDHVTGSRVVDLIELVQVAPTRGRGRPKRLGSLPGVWSRRISVTHRLFYVITDAGVHFLQCWGHDLPRELEDAIRQGRWSWSDGIDE